jgi:hypothetical protein
MDLEMVLNELSVGTPATDIPTARKLMSNLIQTLIQATKSGVKKVLRTENEINNILIAVNYPIARWRNDPDVPREEQTFFRSLTAKAPFWSDADPDIKDNFDLSEVFYQGRSAIGLRFALISDALAISLLSDVCWDCSQLELELGRLEDEDFIEEKTIIFHASRSSHVIDHSEWIANKIKQNIQDGVDLWQSKAELFPHLEFCLNVERQLEQMVATNAIFQQILKRLSELEEAAHNWTEGSFNLDSLPTKVTPESESRLKDFSRELTFVCPDGVTRLFSLHSRFTPGAGRLYFSSDLGPGKIIIGYIGKKIQ